MPTIRKMSQEEAQDLQSKKLTPRQQTAHMYDAMIANFELGEWGEVILDEGDNKLTVRNRLVAAADRRGFKLSFRRTPAAVVRFQITLPDES